MTASKELLIKFLLLFYLNAKKQKIFFSFFCFLPEIFQSPRILQWETLLQCRLKRPKRQNESCLLQFREWHQDNSMGCRRINFQSLIGRAQTCVLPPNSFLHLHSSKCLAVVVQVLPKCLSTCCDGTNVFRGRYRQCPLVRRQFQSHFSCLWEAHSIASSLFGKIGKLSGQLGY